jgi:putative FmdB family regulatory protein
MPLYEYECTQCGAIEEALQKFSDKPLTQCAQCKGKLRKLISSSAFHLKGSGWYVTDYAKKPKTSSTPAENGKQAKSPGAQAGSGTSKSGNSAD